MAPMKTKASVAGLEKLRWCRQLELAMKAGEALEAYLTNTKDLDMSVNFKGAANIACKIGTLVVIEANIRNVHWLVTANEIVRTAKMDAKRYSMQTIARWMSHEEG